MGAETGVVELEAEECQEIWQPLEVSRSKKGFFPSALRGSSVSLTPWLWISSFLNVDRINVSFFSSFLPSFLLPSLPSTPPVVGICFRGLKETHIEM